MKEHQALVRMLKRRIYHVRYHFAAVKEAVVAGDKDKGYGRNYPPWSQLKVSAGKKGLEAKEASATYRRNLYCMWSNANVH